MFKLKEDVIILMMKSKSKELFRIRANQWIDFNASYSLNDLIDNKTSVDWQEKECVLSGKASYDILDAHDQPKFKIQEDSAWVRFWDSFVGELPIIGMFTGYFLNPSYTVTGIDGKAYFKLKKMPSFFGRRFQLDRLIDIDDEEESPVILSLLMMTLLERARG